MNTKSVFIVVFFRTSAFFSKNKVLKVIGMPIRISYRLIVQWMLGVDLPDRVKAGRGLVIYHGQGLVVHENVSLGSNVVLRQCTTIGSKISQEGVPRIHDFVDVGANVVILGDIDIGKGSVIGAGSVVVRSVPDYTVVAGNPAKVIGEIHE